MKPKKLDYKEFKDDKYGYYWRNQLFENLWGTTGVNGDLIIRQRNLKTKKEYSAYGKREMAWGPTTSLIIQYIAQANYPLLRTISKENSQDIFEIDKEPIEKFLSQQPYMWEKENEVMNNFALNTPIENHYSFIRVQNNHSELHLMTYNRIEGIRLFDILQKPNQYLEKFNEEFIYQHTDCVDLITAVAKLNPYKGETLYGIKHFLEK